MDTEKGLEYMLVDDDATNNLVCRLMISKFDASAPIEVFSSPEKGLEHIEHLSEKVEQESPKSIILFLDINMPTMTGWDFLDQFIKFSEKLKSQFQIYILTSAIEDFGLERKKYPFIKDILTKPLKKEDLAKLK